MMRTWSACRAWRPFVGLAVYCLALTVGCSTPAPSPSLAPDRAEVSEVADAPQPGKSDPATEGGSSEAPRQAGTAEDVDSGDGVRSQVEVVLASQQQLDETVRKPEVLAQQHESVFVDFWDRRRFVEDSITAPTVARTGWAWGASEFDFDLDGDRDVYVANGFQSGKSCRDFCTKYWTHWTYMDSTGPVKNTLLDTMMKPVWRGEESWNGYEHNALLMNRDGGEFLNVGLLFDAAFVYDSRAAITEDFDGDGRPDLLVSQVTYEAEEEVRTHATLRVYLNQLVTDHRWVGVNVLAGPGGRSPVGATVTVETDVATQRQWLMAGDALYGQESNIAHFGLGRSQEIKSIVVRWPDGYAKRLPSPALGKYHVVRGER